MKMQEIADRIDAHLKDMEKNHNYEVNDGLKAYYNSCCISSGKYIKVRYISYQCFNNLRKSEAIEYLEWLDAGNKGKHYKLNFLNR